MSKTKTHHVKVWTKAQTKELYELMLDAEYTVTSESGSWSDPEGHFFKFEDFVSGMKKDPVSDLYVLRIKLGLIVALDEMDDQ